MKTERSEALFARAQKVIPGGVDSPVRAFGAVGGHPRFIERGEGPYVFDADGHRYLDYVCSWGPLILGHAPPTVLAAVEEAARKGTSYGATTESEVVLAERVIAAVPSVERVRFVSSGTEATMSALRVARGFTGRDRFIKFAGCYHGHGDAFLAEGAGSGLATLGLPGSAGVPQGATADTATLPYNDLDAVEDLLKRTGDTIAAIFVEPIACNMGFVPPQEGYLAGLRALCDRYGALLVFDEVMTGFRIGLSGAQGHYGITPDLTTFGKVIGGGLPVGAYGGRAEVMQTVAPEGPVYQAGTLSGNPVAMAAGIAALEAISAPGFFETLRKNTETLVARLRPVLEKHGSVASAHHCGSIFGLYFKAGHPSPARDYDEAKAADTALYGRVFNALLEEGVYLAPSAYEVGFVSSAHQDDDLTVTAEAMDRALGRVLDA